MSAKRARDIVVDPQFGYGTIPQRALVSARLSRAGRPSGLRFTRVQTRH
ncbi:hypothetical protein G6O69_16080 [Pseudenhygromyxa sp. WMMC2535]|nr:hypothetical protein [Pseudenhygromyxa sp. WMMC2535]NVB39362.1 hypothetical protein [Pseudenhygromyxa sp. WMMC2535]